MPTLLLSRNCQPEAGQLASIAAANRWNYQWLSRRKVPQHLHGNKFAILAGTDIALNVCRAHGLALIEPTFELLAELPQRFVQRQIELTNLAEALKIPDRKFIKPTDCTHKAFDAAVWGAGKYIFCADDLSRDTPVLVSDPVAWTVEYRVIVLERKAVTFSPYIRDGRLARDPHDCWPYEQREAEEMLAYCRELLADESVSLPPAFTLDVGIIEGRGWAVIEFNPVWCSGLLGCDLSVMLPVLSRACVFDTEVSAADREWIIRREVT